ncbi:hypothetical protein F5I97DRAFT_1656722 [Phlebopus sp. FC_14]|nr:hypothetical protein F5I97DRAFT_1656722 [Phlebopus sp. FC_14]
MPPIGPQIPAHLSGAAVSNDVNAGSDEDDYTPALPPDLAAARKVARPSLPHPSVGPSTRRSHSRSRSPAPRRVIGPTLPSAQPSYDSDSGSDDVGPQPLPAAAGAGAPAEERSGVQQFLEREERRRQAIEEAKQPKKLVREEWMLVPPKRGDLLGSLDPTKLKARQFGRGSTTARDSDSSLWTETPAERQQRLADEVSGRKRRAVNAEPEEDPDELRKRQRRDEEIRKGVAEHTRKSRGGALVETHLERVVQSKDRDKSPPVIWDHSRDMSVGGRLMDDSQRQKMLHDAKGLGQRFGTGKSGGFL